MHREQPVSLVTGGLLALAGVVLSLVSFEHTLREHTLEGAALVGGVVPTLLALSIVVEGVVLARSDVERRGVGDVVGWALVGAAVTGLVALSFVVYERSHGIGLVDVAYLYVNSLTVGIAGGFLVGYYHADRRKQTEQVREEHARLEEEREKLELLTRIVHHDIGNDLTVVHGMDELLEDHVDEPGRQYLARLQRATTDAVDVTRTAREFVNLLDDETDRDVAPISLRNVLETQVDNASATYPQASIVCEEVPDVEVLADEMLSSVFRNLLTNAVQHSDADVPHVECTATVDDEVARVRIADNGPGIDDERKGALFEREESTLDSGLGLYLVDQLVAGYGGDVRVEDSEMGGAAFVVELRLSDTYRAGT
ncbi:MAG: ATP-binding protein [Haloferacaceae archaeon]